MNGPMVLEEADVSRLGISFDARQDYYAQCALELLGEAEGVGEQVKMLHNISVFNAVFHTSSDAFAVVKRGMLKCMDMKKRRF